MGQVSKRDKTCQFLHSVFACETALKCAVKLKSVDPKRMLNEQHFSNVWALAAV